MPVTRDAPDARIAAIVAYWAAGPSNQPAGAPAATSAGEDAAAGVSQSGNRLLGVLALIGVVVVLVGTGLVLRSRSQRQFGAPPRRRSPVRDPQPAKPEDETSATTR